MTERTAWNLSGLSRSYHGVPIDQLPAEVRRALLAAGRVAWAEDGTLVALTNDGEEPEMMEYEDELPVITGADIVRAIIELSRQNEALAAELGVSLEAAREGGYVALDSVADDGELVGFTATDDDDGWQLTAADLDGGVEAQLAYDLGAASRFSDGRSEAEIEDDKAAEIARLTHQQDCLQMGSAVRFTPAPWDARQLPEPVDGRDPDLSYDFGVKLSHDELVRDVVSQRCEELGLCAESQDDRIVGLDSAVRRANDPAMTTARDRTEVRRYLAGAFGQGNDAAFGLGRGEDELRLAAERTHSDEGARLLAKAHKMHIGGIRVPTVDDADDLPQLPAAAHGLSDARLRELGLDQATRLDVKNYHGRPGRKVTSQTRAHHRELDRDGRSVASQPGRGGVGVVKPGRGVYGQSPLGGPEAPSGSAGKPVLSDRSGRVPSARDPYHAPAGKPQGAFMTAGDDGEEMALSQAEADAEIARISGIDIAGINQFELARIPPEGGW